jgi:hypothetical protein
MRTYFVPTPENVYSSVGPLPSGHRARIGRVVEPSSDQAYVQGPFGQMEPEPSNITVCPTTGEVGVTVKLAVGGAGGGGGGGSWTDATIAVAVELAAVDPAALLAVTTARIVCATSVEASI